jgi:hypothetical protein
MVIFDCKNMRGLDPINPRTVLGLDTMEVDRLMPPCEHMGLGKPAV